MWREGRHDWWDARRPQCSAQSHLHMTVNVSTKKRPPGKPLRASIAHSSATHAHIIATVLLCATRRPVDALKTSVKIADWSSQHEICIKHPPISEFLNDWGRAGGSAVYCVNRYDIIRLTLSQNNWRRTVSRIMKWNSYDLYIVMIYIYTYTIIWHCRGVLFSGQVVVAHRESTRLSRRSPVVQHCNYFQKSFSL